MGGNKWIQDVVTAKLDEVTLANDDKLMRIEAEVCKVRSNYERKIENLNNKCHDLLLKLESKKALEDKMVLALRSLQKHG